MDFMQRITPNQPQPPRPVAQPESVELPRSADKNGKRHGAKRDLLAFGSYIGTNALLFIVALLVAAVVWFIYSSSPASQARYVDRTKLQAVFLNTGQVYFGNIQSLNKDYLVLTNVYYLQSSNTTGTSSSSSQANQNISLVKLGCELHMPYDQMVVNTTQVTFWENLQSDGQVGKAVAQFQQQNPNGQKCSNQAAASNSSANLQNSTNTTTNKQ